MWTLATVLGARAPVNTRTQRLLEGGAGTALFTTPWGLLLARAPLEDAGEQAGGHGGRVALPGTAVLVGAPVLVTQAAMGEQDGHEDDVEIG